MNPYEGRLAEGRIEGHEAGLKMGYLDGFHLGTIQGVALGLEIGFLRRRLQLETVTNTSASSNRSLMKKLSLKKILVELTALLDNFPTPHSLLQGQENDQVDVQLELQRIRAKFKLLTTLLQIPHISLKKVLMEEQTSNAAAATPSPQITTTMTTRETPPLIERSTEW